MSWDEASTAGPLSPKAAYRRAQAELGLVHDPAQQPALEALEACYQALHSPRPERAQGVYLWGPVGRGKTWLMDSFYRGLKVPARRQHFHHFMQWVHRRLFALSGRQNPLPALAQELRSELRVLCFDELFVADIGDAMLLGGLFQALFEAGVVLVATSNQAPEQLYVEGFNRARFLPAIAAIERHMQIVAVDGEQDHRLHPGAAQRRYWVNNAGALARVFEALSDGLAVSTRPIAVNGRPLALEAHSEAAIWLRFDQLCEQPFSALDFIALCDRFPAILLGQVPELSSAEQAKDIARGTEDAAEQVAAGERQLPRLSVKDDSVRRFIALVDECYDRGRPLYIEAAVPLTELYRSGHLAFPFRRSLSRLQEMQLQRFGRDPAPEGA